MGVGEAVTPERHATSDRGRLVEQAWIWSVVGYTVLRFVIAWGAFSDHGANVWIFGLLDVGTAWPYAKAVAIVCRRAANSEWRRLGLPIGVALVSFFAPYAYLWIAAGEMPGGLRTGLAVCVAVLAAAAASGIVSRVRKLRAEQPPTEPVGAAPDDVLIDLTTEPARLVLNPGGAADRTQGASAN